MKMNHAATSYPPSAPPESPLPRDRFTTRIQALLEHADIRVQGTRPWDIVVHDRRFARRVLAEGTLGLGEAYMEGWWDCQALDQLTERAVRADLQTTLETSGRVVLDVLLARVVNMQSPTRSRHVIDRHYDLDADFFMSFLDPYNQYTCGYFKDTDQLNLAQEHKLDLICRKLQLKPSDHVLDIGCGWGGFSKFAAERYGCRVTGISISDEQIKFARGFCAGLPVEIQKCDYRDLRGSFDKVLVCGMLEHVGPRNYRNFARIVRSVLKPNGIFLLHTIGGNKPQSRPNPWLHTYIFPNYQIPAVAELGAAFSGLFSMEDWHNFGPYYDPTLVAWNKNFERNWPQLSKRYSESFRRMWNYYFLSCAGYFRARRSQLWQVVLTPIGATQPASRLS